ncbi:MAG: hypothetical protein U5K27_02625 [Desulfotignum sp.]|nr:hypothetical protein [Desulfotignum sp.]
MKKGNFMQKIFAQIFCIRDGKRIKFHILRPNTRCHFFVKKIEQVCPGPLAAISDIPFVGVILVIEIMQKIKRKYFSVSYCHGGFLRLEKQIPFS